MHSIHDKFKEFRYKLEYAFASYKQRYYSNDTNPRVIQTKLKNSTLISLRTCPNDKYIIKQGEFLALEKKTKNESHDTSNLIDLESPMNMKIKNMSARNSLFKGFDDSVYLEHTAPTFESDAKNIRRVQSFADTKSLRNDHDNIKTTDTNKGTEEPIQILSSGEGADRDTGRRHSFKRKIIDGMHRKRKSGTPMIPSPIPEVNSAATNNEENSKSEQQNHPVLNTTLGEIEAQETPIVRRINSSRKLMAFNGGSRVQSLVSRISTASVHSSVNYDAVSRNDQNCSKAWKTILNDVSLSAARVSIGHTPRKSNDFKNLTSDFVECKSEDSENFYENIKPTDLLFNNTLPKHNRKVLGNSLRLTSGNIPVYSSISRPITQDDYYSECGLLSMYNYNSDNDSHKMLSIRE
ncbi:Piso0_004815 [Millerozyma farinosa CBS 7064]|uniref:Piso0_004815 protein n=1 Tax=Pichia sorbitophila (strain ATCC MYA-4447 / BCRC 22081 / CBS 7064 / NBRC 10061 / NRRL Y-12695) TaxID=559304 RepID=G8Y0H9_PICSO|nr:Piso0_004815 [Millerozyma farinosa CBS 7064]